MAREEIVWLPGEWAVGDVVQVDRDGKLVVRGRIIQAIGNSIYRVDVEEGGVGAAAQERLRRSDT